MYEIKDRWTSKVLYRSDSADNVKDALLEAIKNKVNLTYAHFNL